MIANKKGFGTFGGVFVPNILTILGVIMYLRMGWVVGNAGLQGALVMVLIANLITLFTAFSISSIATNMRMKGGGAYYLISRSLGAEVGGSIGIPLFMAQALVISLYIVGFAESLAFLVPGINQKIITFGTLVVLTVLSLISAGLVIRIQYIILSVIGLSLFSFFSGQMPSFDTVHLASSYKEGYDFWSVFAVFFPAVTGILSGVSLSGDLRDPAKSVPSGTILSVAAGAFIYFLIACWFGFAGDLGELRENNLVMVTMARWGPLIFAGIWGATLSSALANILAAPRTLQALARDGIVFRIFRKGRGPNQEPILATLFTFILVGGVLMVGELNTIAPVLTIFFLITYGSINVISFLEGIIKRPKYRPTFRVHWLISLTGAIGSIWVMFLINAVACILGFTLVLIIYVLLKRKQIQRSWGDWRRGMWSALIQFGLVSLERTADHHVAWRPSVLLVSRNLISKQKLIEVAFALTRRSGFLACINLHRSGEFDAKKLGNDAAQFRKMLQEKRIHAFYRNAMVDHYLSGQMIASQLHGIGEFMHNTILLDWHEVIRGGVPHTASESVDQFRLIRFYSELNHSLMLLNVNPEVQRSRYQSIDVWWDPGQRNGSFMLVLAHLFSSSRYWGESRLSIKTVVLQENVERTKDLLKELVTKSRIKAEITVLHPDSEQEANLGDQFERFKQRKRRQEKWVGTFRQVIGISSLSRERTLERLHPLEWEPGEQEDEGDEVLKEQLSDQMKDRDEFIINRHINEIIVRNSVHADLVMLGFNLPRQGKEKKYIDKMDALLINLPDTLLINCPFDFDLFD